jgi:hypothetical protein
MSLEQLNAELKYVRVRLQVAGSGAIGRAFRKEIALLESVRLRRFGVASQRS